MTETLPTTPEDPELALMETLQTHVESFGPKTAASVMTAVLAVVGAARNVPDAALDRAMAWIEARTDERLRDDQARRNRERRPEPSAEGEPVEPQAEGEPVEPQAEGEPPEIPPVDELPPVSGDDEAATAREPAALLP